MTPSLTAALVLAGSLGVASAATAATPAIHHPAARAALSGKAAPVRVMSEASDPNPSLTDVFADSDGAFYTPPPPKPVGARIEKTNPHPSLTEVFAGSDGAFYTPPQRVSARAKVEASNPDPSLTDVFAASDGAFYTPVTHDPRVHGLPEY